MDDKYPFPPPPPSLEERIAALEILASGAGPETIEDAQAAVNPSAVWPSIAASNQLKPGGSVATPLPNPAQPAPAIVR